MKRRILLPLVLIVLIALAGGGFVAYQLNRAVPALAATRSLPTVTQLDGTPPNLPWPTKGAAAVGIMGMGPLAHSQDVRPRPIASVTKIMTAYQVLIDYPLLPGDRGPTVTITTADVANYQRELADGQSVVFVQQGEQLTEYQLLQALLLPSGNNIAEVLAAWDAGSVDAFVANMNARATELGMTSTHFADASGVSPQTVSNAPDLILLTQAALDDPVFADIVSQQEATIPVAGTVFNVDTALGQNGIVGVKTGSTPEAGGCFV
ncbi:MAG: hypothetical protein QOF51_2816, partial [Chloroflexota bacterium]|nr:hypothetical protein [Chloroflexota bacterium]